LLNFIKDLVSSIPRLAVESLGTNRENVRTLALNLANTPEGRQYLIAFLARTPA